jgi:SAM-dependent methyltransferase
MPGMPHHVRRELHEDNRLSWNAATDAHNSHKGDQAAFFRGGGCKLYPEERALLGDVRGLDVVHLQCNSGQDSLSIANLGARRVLGVDISDTAVAFANRLAAEAGIANVNFVRSDIYDYFANPADPAVAAPASFDVAFSSYGTLCWMSDLSGWSRGVAAVLKPDGRLVLVDYHPVSQVFDPQLRRRYPYFADGAVLTWADGVGDYVAETGGPSPYGELLPGVVNFRNPHRAHEFQWTIGEIVTAVLDAGLALTTLREFPYANGFAPFKGMRQHGADRWILPPETPNLPLMYALGARKPL